MSNFNASWLDGECTCPRCEAIFLLEPDLGDDEADPTTARGA
jgi:hypothetical protein